MKHYAFALKTWGDLAAAYPHSPEDLTQSYLDFLEDQLENGLTLVSASFDSGWYFTFRVSGST